MSGSIGFTILWFFAYAVLNVGLFFMLQGYIKENKTPDIPLSIITALGGIGTIYMYPKPSDSSSELMGDFVIFAIACLIPFSQMSIITTKFIAELLINNDDFNPEQRRNYLSEVKIPLDNLTMSGKYVEAIEFLLEKQASSKYQKDYRICIEIATIAMTNLGNIDLALDNYKKVLIVTTRTEAVAYSLYRMADIYIQNPETREKARECLNQLVEKFPNNEYGKSANLRLKIMERENSGEAFGMMGGQSEAAFEAAAPDASSLQDMTSQVSIEDTARRLLADQAPESSHAPVRQDDAGYQQLLQKSAEKAIKKGAETNELSDDEHMEIRRRTIRPDMPNPLASLMPASSAGAKSVEEAPEGSYQSLLSKSQISSQQKSVKKSRAGKTGMLNELRLKKDNPGRDISRSDYRPDTGSLRKKSQGLSIPKVMSDSEAYQMMLRSQGVQVIGGSAPQEQPHQNVNVQDDGITGFTRLRRARKNNL
ncbi:MAG: tetratricopeptide repeat protein [bacterium]|nr:tetratricopeptide repeat protein [bacterium]